MKKSSKLLRASGILLVLTMITSCFVGGTFAKYITTGGALDSARVAEWGVKVTASGGEAFELSYDYDTTPNPGGKAVQSRTEINVVAPGTSGTFGGIEITGVPEVAVDVTTTAVVTMTGDWKDSNGDFYCPLVFTIGDETICGLEYSGGGGTSGMSGFIDAIQTAIHDASSKKFAPGNGGIGSQVDVAYSWSWPFEGDDHTTCATDHNTEQTDTLDTKLGDLETAPSISIDVTTTVTQID